MLYLAIPAYNEVETIGVLLWRLRTVLAEFPREYEVVVYDDASTDDTAEVAAQYERAMPVSVIRGTTHLGYAGAVEALLRDVAGRTRYPRRDAVLLLQGDFTDPPGMVPEFARRFEGGADLVVGERLVVADAPTAVKRLFKGAQWAMRPFVRVEGVRDLTASMRLMRISVLRDALRTVPTALLTGDTWTANADLLLHLVPHARRVEAVPLEPTYGVRIRETRRNGFRDALGTLKWAWAARGRRAVAGSAPDLGADPERRHRQSGRRRDEAAPLSVERIREKVRERDGTHGIDGNASDGRRGRRGRERTAADSREMIDPAAGPRSERPAERAARPERSERADRQERAPRSERAPRDERTERPERTAERPDRDPAARKPRESRERTPRADRPDVRPDSRPDARPAAPRETTDTGRDLSAAAADAIDFDDPFAPRTPRPPAPDARPAATSAPVYAPPAMDTPPAERRPVRPAVSDDALYDDVAAGRPRDRSQEQVPVEAPVWRPPADAMDEAASASGGAGAAGTSGLAAENPSGSRGRSRRSGGAADARHAAPFDPAALPVERARPLQHTDAHDDDDGAPEGPLSDVDLDDEAAARVTGEFAYGLASAAIEADDAVDDELDADVDAAEGSGADDAGVNGEAGAPRKRRRNRRSRRGRRRRGERAAGEAGDVGPEDRGEGAERDDAGAGAGIAEGGFPSRARYADAGPRPTPADHVDGEPVYRPDAEAEGDDFDDEIPEGDDRHAESMSEGAPRPRRRGRRGRRGGARRSRNRRERQDGDGGGGPDSEPGADQ